MEEPKDPMRPYKLRISTQQSEQINGQFLFIVEGKLRFDGLFLFYIKELDYSFPDPPSFSNAIQKTDIFFSVDLRCPPKNAYRFYTMEEEPERYSLHWLPGSPPFFDTILGLIGPADGQRYVKNFNKPPPQNVQWRAWTISEHTQATRILDYADDSHSRWYAIPEFQDPETLRWSVKFVPEGAIQLDIYVPVKIEVVDG